MNFKNNTIIPVEKLKNFYFELDDYFRPTKKEAIKKIYQDIAEIRINTDFLNEGYNKKEIELEVPYGLIKLNLLLYFTNSDVSYGGLQLFVEDIIRFDFYDVFGEQQELNINSNTLFEILKLNINQSIY